MHDFFAATDPGRISSGAIPNLYPVYADPKLLSAFEALWNSPPIAIPLKGLGLKCLLQPPAKRPGKRAEAHYLAA